MHYRHGQDIDSIENICRTIANDLLAMRLDYPLTIIYMPLKWCGFVHRALWVLISINHLVHRYKRLKEEILSRLVGEKQTLRVIFATVAFGIGVDTHCVRQVIHIGPPRTIREHARNRQSRQRW